MTPFRHAWIPILLVCGLWTALSSTVLAAPGPVHAAGALLAMAGAGLLLGWVGLFLQAEMSPAVAGGTIAAIASIPQGVQLFFWAASPEGHAGRLPFIAPSLVLMGGGWSSAALFHRFRRGQAVIPFREGSWVELLALLIATLDAFWMVLKRSLSLWDSLVLLGVFALYLVFAGRLEPAPPVREGPLSDWRHLGFPWRQIALTLLGAAAGTLLLLAWKDLSRAVSLPAGSGPWLEALAGQSPVLLTGLLLILQDRPRLGIRVLVASLVIQVSLLVALIPVGPMLARRSATFALDPDQVSELGVYASMLFYGVLLLSGLALTAGAAISLAAMLAGVILIEGPWGSWLAAAGIIGSCVVLVLSRRRSWI